MPGLPEIIQRIVQAGKGLLRNKDKGYRIKDKGLNLKKTILFIQQVKFLISRRNFTQKPSNTNP